MIEVSLVYRPNIGPPVVLSTIRDTGFIEMAADAALKQANATAARRDLLDAGLASIARSEALHLKRVLSSFTGSQHPKASKRSRQADRK